jgi:hypothetical protein
MIGSIALFLLSDRHFGAGCHGQRPSIFTTSDQLKNVWVTIAAARTPIFVKVGAAVTVLITSAATRNSKPGERALPKAMLFALLHHRFMLRNVA